MGFSFREEFQVYVQDKPLSLGILLQSRIPVEFLAYDQDELRIFCFGTGDKPQGIYCGLPEAVVVNKLSRNSQGTVDEVKKQIELGLLGSSKGRIQLVVLMNLHLKFRNKERTKEIQDLSQSLDMTNDDSRENRREPTRQ
ncbi:hypothetical protein BY996DRAFT_6546665 [Phakopsora pachyrhizi]|nr:hypothetical protein BY996DRAFT_6546665 [Phakopsora pachyrhizi]